MITIDRDETRRRAQGAIDAERRTAIGPFAFNKARPVLAPREVVALLDALERAEGDAFRQRAAMNRERDRAVRAEAQSEARRQQTKYWKERADLFEAKMNELDRAHISEHGQRRRAEDEQDRLKNKLARRSETVSRLLEERSDAEARIQAVRDLHRRSTIYDHVDGCPDTSDAHADSYHEEDMDHRDEYYCTLSPVQDVCFECSDEDSGDIAAWPCPTIRALDAP